MPSGRIAKYPFRDLEIGQSFTVPAGEGMNLTNMRVYCNNRSAELGRSFTAEKLDNGAIRVKRVDPSTRHKQYSIEG